MCRESSWKLSKLQNRSQEMGTMVPDTRIYKKHLEYGIEKFPNCTYLNIPRNAVHTANQQQQ
jgi:hypothetical protein